MTSQPKRAVLAAIRNTTRSRSPSAGPSTRTVIGATIAALAVSAFVNHRLARKAERDNPPAGRFLNVDGVRLHHVERGSGEPLVVLHGNRRGWFARIDRAVLLTGGIVVIALVLVVAALGQAKEIAIPTFLAALGAIALAPPARWLEREGRAEATDPREPFRSAFVDKGWPRSPNFRFPSPPVTDRRRGRRVSC